MEITVTELDVIDQCLPADMAARDDNGGGTCFLIPGDRLRGGAACRNFNVGVRQRLQGQSMRARISKNAKPQSEKLETGRGTVGLAHVDRRIEEAGTAQVLQSPRKACAFIDPAPVRLPPGTIRRISQRPLHARPKGFNDECRRPDDAAGYMSISSCVTPSPNSIGDAGLRTAISGQHPLRPG
jgi:hypothetical protein